ERRGRVGWKGWGGTGRCGVRAAAARTPYPRGGDDGPSPLRPRFSRSHPRVIKKILLCVPAMFAEIGFGELPQQLRRHLPSTRKIILPQYPLDPDVDRKCSQPLIGKKHHAICNLRTDARQHAQLFSEL